MVLSQIKSKFGLNLAMYISICFNKKVFNQFKSNYIL